MFLSKTEQRSDEISATNETESVIGHIESQDKTPSHLWSSPRIPSPYEYPIETKSSLNIVPRYQKSIVKQKDVQESGYDKKPHSQNVNSNPPLDANELRQRQGHGPNKSVCMHLKSAAQNLIVLPMSSEKDNVANVAPDGVISGYTAVTTLNNIGLNACKSAVQNMISSSMSNRDGPSHVNKKLKINSAERLEQNTNEVIQYGKNNKPKAKPENSGRMKQSIKPCVAASDTKPKFKPIKKAIFVFEKA